MEIPPVDVIMLSLYFDGAPYAHPSSARMSADGSSLHAHPMHPQAHLQAPTGRLDVRMWGAHGACVGTTCGINVTFGRDHVGHKVGQT